MKELIGKWLVWAILLSTLSGCAVLEGNPATARFAVQYATLKVIKDDHWKAARVVQIVTQAAELLDESSATIALLEAAVRSSIDWDKLDAADTLLADNLIIAVKFELEKRVGDSLLDPEKTFAIKMVLSWIIEAAES